MMNAAEQRRREVHDTLLPILAEKYGEQVRVHEAEDAEKGAVTYGFPLPSACGLVSVVTFNERATSVAIHVRLGRSYVGYRRALHWLACNRAGNTVALLASEEHIAARELWVSSNRVTLPGDADGIRVQLADVEGEFARSVAGMVWFPQLLDGGRLTELEKQASTHRNEAAAGILAQPQSFVEWVGENKIDAMDNWSLVPVEVYGWLGRWREQLAFMDEQYNRLPKETQQASREGYLLYRLMALCQLNRHQDVIPICDELENLSANWRASSRAVVPRMRALNGLAQYEESLELAKPAIYDTEPRVWYLRGEALALLERRVEAFQCFQKYEILVGQDIIARQHIRRLFPKDWRPEEEKTA